jgi:hypothetical protein
VEVGRVGRGMYTQMFCSGLASMETYKYSLHILHLFMREIPSVSSVSDDLLNIGKKNALSSENLCEHRTPFRLHYDLCVAFRGLLRIH